MEALLWNLRTLSGLQLVEPILEVLAIVLIVFWDFPLLLPYSLAQRLRGEPRRPSARDTRWPAALVVIPSLLRRHDELASMRSTIASVAGNGYPGQLVIVLSIDGTHDAPDLNAELVAWASRQALPSGVSLHVTGTPQRRGKPMAIDHAIEFVQGLVSQQRLARFPEVYISTDADADLGPQALTRLVARLQRRHFLTGAPARVVAGALHVREDNFWQGFRRALSVEGQLTLQVAREYYVSNVARHNIRWLPLTGVPGALYCTWSEIFINIPRFLAYSRSLGLRDWLRWWVGVPPPSFTSRDVTPVPELMAGDTDDTVSAYVATIARYERGRFCFDPPRTPLHALQLMLRALLFERAIAYEPRARVYTSSPASIKALIKQRRRWNASRIELSGRFFGAIAYHWSLGIPVMLVKALMARSVLVGAIAYVYVPLFVWKLDPLTTLVLSYLCHLLIHGMLTGLTLLINGELKYWRLLYAVPLTPVYLLVFNWLPGALGALSDVLGFGNVTGFAPETTLIRGGSSRIALAFRVRRAAALLLRAVVAGDVPFGWFWFGWHETKWTPNGFEGWTSGQRPRAIVPPLSEWFRGPSRSRGPQTQTRSS